MSFDIAPEQAKEQMKVEMGRLTSAQKAIIVKTFQAVNEAPSKNGQVLFAKYFTEHPDYKEVWPQFRAVQDSALILSDALRRHCIVYMAGLKDVVGAMDDDERLAHFTGRIAKSHVKWNIYKHHVTNMLPGLMIVLQSSLGADFNADVEDAWTTLYDVIGNLLQIQKKMCPRKAHSL